MTPRDHAGKPKQSLRRLSRPGLVCALCLLAAGCHRGLFKARGYVASEGGGGVLGSWQSAPDACSRDPIDGEPIGRSSTVATFIWEDPSVHDPMRDQHRAAAADAPLRLELSRSGKGYSAVVTTVRTDRLGPAGTAINASDCAVLSLQTWEQAPIVAGSRSALAGRLRMDCQVRGSHVTADLEFARCEF